MSIICDKVEIKISIYETEKEDIIREMKSKHVILRKRYKKYFVQTTSYSINEVYDIVKQIKKLHQEIKNINEKITDLQDIISL